MENVLVERIKGWYERGLWTEKMVRKAVVKGVITAEVYRKEYPYNRNSLYQPDY